MKRNMRHTKIVATVGPASSSFQTLEALIGAGVDVFRLNFSHGTHESHHTVCNAIRAAAEGLDTARSLGDAWWTAQFELWSAMGRQQLGDVDGAAAMGAAGTARARSLDDARLLIFAALLFAAGGDTPWLIAGYLSVLAVLSVVAALAAKDPARDRRGTELTDLHAGRTAAAPALATPAAASATRTTPERPTV